jgi:protein-S-isoprenylcysteine O-methyltransferase Ste14
MDTADRVLAAQVLAMAALGWPGRGRWSLPGTVRTAAGAVTVAGGALAVAALARQGGQLTPKVEPVTGAELITDGPYRFSRHPVYAGLLVGAAGFATLRRRPEPLVAWAVLAAVLHLKSGLEERRLRARFGRAYDDYALRTPRLLGLPRG